MNQRQKKGHYYATITSNGAQAVAAFSIERLAHSITIQNGTTEIADSKAEEDTIVTIKADPAPAGKVFDKWVVESGNITLADANSATTTFTMPDSAVSVKATYTDAPQTGTPTEPAKPENPDSPQTGDNSHMALWIALLFVSGAGVIGTTVYGKKKRAK